MPLHLVDRLARVELDRGGIDTARVRAPLGAREPERIQGLGLVLRVADQRDARVGRRVEHELRVRQVAPRPRMVAIAVSYELARRSDATDGTAAPTALDA